MKELAWMFRRISVWTGRMALYFTRFLTIREQENIFDMREREEIESQKKREKSCKHPKDKKRILCINCGRITK